jgi:hypothetical protein
MADLLRQILRMDGFVARFGEIVQPFTRIAVVAQGFIEELAIGFFFQQRQQGGRVDLISPTSAISTLLCAPMLAGLISI